MLSVDMRYRSKVIPDIDMDYKPDNWFIKDFRPDWFDDELVRKLIEIIDKNEFTRLPAGKGAWKSNYIMTGPRGYVEPSNLSTGVKCLILLYKTNRSIVTKTLGDNCIELLPWLGDRCNITVIFDCLRPMSIDGSKSGVKLIQTGKIYHDTYEFSVDMLGTAGGKFD